MTKPKIHSLQFHPPFLLLALLHTLNSIFPSSFFPSYTRSTQSSLPPSSPPTRANTYTFNLLTPPQPHTQAPYTPPWFLLSLYNIHHVYITLVKYTLTHKGMCDISLHVCCIGLQFIYRGGVMDSSFCTHRNTNNRKCVHNKRFCWGIYPVLLGHLSYITR